MKETDSTQPITRVREQLLLTQIRVAELEDALSELAARLDHERHLAEEAQRLADCHPGGPTVDSLAAELALAQDRIAMLDAERRAMKESFVWRCMAPLRSFQRWRGRRRQQ